jgi:inorganic pyrophosphatase
MPNLSKLPTWSEDGSMRVVIETPRASRAKLKYDPKFQIFILSKSLFLGLTYPYDWGFIPSTCGEDGDPLDVMVIHDAATAPGLVLTCKPIGLLELAERNNGKRKRNDRIFAIPVESHLESDLTDVRELTKPSQVELERFFVATSELQKKEIDCLGWRGPKHAGRLIRAGEKRFAQKSNK